MKLALIIAAALAVAGSAAAADHSGHYVSVHDRSSWSNDKFPKDFKLAIDLKFGPNQVDYKSLNTTNPAQPGGAAYVARLDGTPTMRPGNPRFDRIVWRQRTPDQFEVLEIKGEDDVIVGSFWTFMPDGKTLIRRGVGKDAQGVSKAYEEVFIKQ